MAMARHLPRRVGPGVAAALLPACGASSRSMGTFALDDGALSPQVAPDAWVAPNAVVVGDVRLGARSSVWFGAVIRGDRDRISLGEETNVQDGAVLHTDAGVPMTLGRRVTVGHMAMLHGCTVGDCSLVGIGATVLNNAVIGKHCLIGAGALVTEGKVIPDGSMVMGINKVVRQLTEQEIKGLERTALGYVQNQARYRATLKPSNL